jgi:hypothetical protein
MPGRPFWIIGLLTAAGAGALAATLSAPSPVLAPTAVSRAADDAVEGQSAVEAVRLHLRRAGLSDELLGLETHRQDGAREMVVVCGRIATRQGGGLVDVVARVMETPRSNAAMAASASRPLPPFVVLEDGPGLNRNRPQGEAWRRHCQAAAEPAAAVPEPTLPPVAAAPPSFTPASATAVEGGGWQVLMRGPGNVRSGPGGGAAVLRVAPRGTSLTVLDRAPGGWLQVDDGAGGGWVHGSLVEAP